jgi:hypothetical protein
MRPVEVDAAIVDAIRLRLVPAEGTLWAILSHVAQVGFDPTARERARGELAGIAWQGRVLRGADQIPPLERHYVKHVLMRREWPPGTSLADYVESLRAVILDPTSGVFACSYQGEAQLAVIRETGTLRGPNGLDWVLVEYRVATGHWVTAYQPEGGIQDLGSPRRTDLLWLREPAQANG